MRTFKCEFCDNAVNPDEWPNREDGMCDECIEAEMAESWSGYVASGARREQMDEFQ